MTNHHQALMRSHSLTFFGCATRPLALYRGLQAFFLLFAALTSQTSILYAQQALNQDEEILRVRTDLVIVPLFVTDSQGRRITGLMQSDFTLRDDGRAAAIAYFAAGTDRVALLFALDSSGSIRERIAEQRETARALFSRFGRGSHVAVERFGETAELVVPFTTNSDEALAAFDLSAIQDRRTAIFDAALAAIHAYDTRRGDPTERRIVILISDGLDTVSSVKPSAVIEAARARDVSIYAIQLPLYAPRDGRLAPRRAAKGYREMAEQTGGLFFMAGDVSSALDSRVPLDLSAVFKAVEEDLRGQYVLGYYAGDGAPDSRAHRIEVSLTPRNNRKLRVRSLRQGYVLNR